MHPQRNLITEAQNIVSEGSRGLKRTERVLGAIEKKAVESGMNPDTMYAKPEGEFAQRGRAFQLRQTDAARGGHIAGGSPGIDTQRMEPTEGEQDAGGKRRDPGRPHGSARIGTVSRVYTSRETPSDVARADAMQKGALGDPEKVKAIDATDQRIRDLSDKITSMRPEVATANHQAQVLDMQRQRQQNFPTARDRVATVASKVRDFVRSV